MSIRGRGRKPVTVTRIDWFRLLMDLKRAGMTLEGIAQGVDVSKSTVIGWKNLDAEPKHWDGEKLIVLWLNTTGLTRSAVPLALKPGELPPPVTPTPRAGQCKAKPKTQRRKAKKTRVYSHLDQLSLALA